MDFRGILEQEIQIAEAARGSRVEPCDVGPLEEQQASVVELADALE